MKKLSLFLKGDRDYVQGSQIISRLSDFLPSEEQFILESTSFNKITNKSIYFVDNDDNANLKNNFLGYEIFKSLPNNEIKKYFFLEDVNHLAPHIEEHEIDLIYSILFQKGLSADINFTVRYNFESIIESIIFFVKKIHAEYKENISNIWFSAVNKSDIPIVNEQKKIQAKLSIDNLMDKKINNKFLTLSNITFNSSETNFSCNIIFAYDLP